jgi:hypothetical protein
MKNYNEKMRVGDGDQVSIHNTSSSTWHCQKVRKCCLERMMNNELCKQAVYRASQSTKTSGDYSSIKQKLCMCSYVHDYTPKLPSI